MELSGHDLRLDYLSFDAWEQEKHNEELGIDEDACQEGEVDEG